jgi:hypothetical protein
LETKQTTLKKKNKNENIIKFKKQNKKNMDFPPELLRKIFSYQKKWWLTNDLRLIDIAKLWRIPRTIVRKTKMYQNTYQDVCRLQLKISGSTKTYILVYMELSLLLENNRKLLYFAVDFADSTQNSWESFTIGICQDRVHWKLNSHFFG